jgi:hypothetical protein
MPLALSIVTNTPVWVFVLLGYLVWQGIVSLKPRTLPIWRVMVVPAVFILMGLSRIALDAGDGPWPVLAWIGAALVLAPLGCFTGPALQSIDRAHGRVTRAGSAIPLIRNVTVFVLQYAVAVGAALHPDSHTTMALIGRAVSGATAGYFIGWALAFLRRASLVQQSA